MAVKEGNKVVAVTLTPFHQKKLGVIKMRTGLNNSGVFQRLLEGHNIFEMEISSKEETSMKKGY